MNIGIARDGDWSQAPEWAKWKAQDAEGIWSWFSTKPQPYNFGLYANGTFLASGKGKKEQVDKGYTHYLSTPNKDWRKTVSKRPTTPKDTL